MSGVVRGRLAFFVFLLAVGCVRHDVGVLITQAHTAGPAIGPILGLVVFLVKSYLGTDFLSFEMNTCKIVCW